MNAVVRRPGSRRLILLIVFDAVAWAVGLTVAALTRMDFDAELVPWTHVLVAWILVVPIFTALAWSRRLHHGRANVASLEEMLALGLIAGSAGAVLFFLNLSQRPPPLPRSIPLTAIFIALAVMAGGRAVWRQRVVEVRHRDRPEGGTSVLVLGAGDGGRQLLRSMLADTTETWNPVGLLDDDIRKRHLHIHGVPVLGTSADLGMVAERTQAAVLVVAIPSAGAAFIRTVTQTAIGAGLEVKVVPGVNELLNGRVDIHTVRDLNLADLLGRHQVETDLAAIAGYLTERRVLVTGAGGSIGSELCRQIHQFGPSELIMLDRDESALHAVQLSLHGRALLDSAEVVLGDIRDQRFVNEIFLARRPQVVFHAAALKHLPMLELYPGEAIKTNIWGTLTLLEAAKANRIERFVNISTDKAANPISVLGYSKRIAEGLTAATAAETDGTYLSVRFGNVLGSRGSVLTAFTAQIETGSPVTVTDPEVTRYFMTVQEAVALVIQAAAIGRDGEALVLDMGEPVRIDAVARQLIELSGRDIEVQYTGLRHGEKLHETLFGYGEPDQRPVHPLVSHVAVPTVNELAARSLDPWAAQHAVISAIARVCRDMSVERPSVLTSDHRAEGRVWDDVRP
jgi:FlaA1/EpsC-like NDP-sugar epimerase